MPAPRTAAEVLARLDELLAQVEPDERRTFWLLIDKHPDNVMRDIHEHMHKTADKTLDALMRKHFESEAKIKKHRKPKKNAERDAEILRLDASDKTDGEIVRALRSDYPNLTAGQVRAVISRDRKKKPKAHGS